jgi:hypothetical protein
MEESISIIQGFAALLWPLGIFTVIFIFRNEIREQIQRGTNLSLEVLGNKIAVNPSKGGEASEVCNVSQDYKPTGKLKPITPEDPLPADYLFLTHISFLRKEKQKQYQKETKMNNVTLFDIRVILNSYYKGALERVSCVKYFLHESYPNPIQAEADIDNHFMLKQLAYGEFVLLAKIWLKDYKTPILMQRYITLFDLEEDKWRSWIKKYGTKRSLTCKSIN